MLVPVEPSTHRTRDGADIRWAGFFTGHRVMNESDVAALAPRLLGIDASAVPEAAEKKLISHYASANGECPALLLHSATATLRAFDGDLAEVAAGRRPHDVATYVEARSAFLGTANDLSVGRTAPWREAVTLWGVPFVDIGDRSHYYLSQALLALAHAHEMGTDTPLDQVIGWLRANPDAVIRVYALDLEMQIFLLWLMDRAGLARLSTDANKPVVSQRWNRKRHVHPTVAAARSMESPDDDAESLLEREQSLSEARERLGLRLPVLPGYTVLRAEASPDAFVADVLAAAELLRTRYGLDRAALKPSEAGDGARIVGNLDLADSERLATEARAAYAHGDDYLLEAWVDFLTADLGDAALPVVPSGHFRNGCVADGITLQTLSGYAWSGNGYLDEPAWTDLALPAGIYRTIRASLEAVREAFLGPPSVLDGSHQGLATGGIDFAVGRVGGRFGDRLLVGAIDFNLSSHGAEYLRTFLDIARRTGVTDRYATTRVFQPPATQTLAHMEAATASMTPPNGLLRAIACVPRRWGMVAATGPDPSTASRRAGELVAVLTDPDGPYAERHVPVPSQEGAGAEGTRSRERKTVRP
ncbi:hypothetical protein ACQEU3_42045 [Spirillospora sp. CA-253888]